MIEKYNVDFLFETAYNGKMRLCSDEAEDTDRGLFLLSSKLELTKEDFIKIFAAINKAIDPYSDDIEDSPISYEQGLNLNTFIEAVNFYKRLGFIKDNRESEPELVPMVWRLA